jgi:hypothetical protein
MLREKWIERKGMWLVLILYSREATQSVTGVIRSVGALFHTEHTEHTEHDPDLPFFESGPLFESREHRDIVRLKPMRDTYVSDARHQLIVRFAGSSSGIPPIGRHVSLALEVE